MKDCEVREVRCFAWCFLNALQGEEKGKKVREGGRGQGVRANIFGDLGLHQRGISRMSLSFTKLGQRQRQRQKWITKRRLPVEHKPSGKGWPPIPAASPDDFNSQELQLQYHSSSSDLPIRHGVEGLDSGDTTPNKQKPPQPTPKAKTQLPRHRTIPQIEGRQLLLSLQRKSNRCSKARPVGHRSFIGCPYLSLNPGESAREELPSGFRPR